MSLAVTVPESAAGPTRELARSVEWARHTAVLLLFGALSFMQDPGRIVADTKLDLVIDPGGFLARTLSLWEPLGFAGQVQNQGYGYLFPMGPFFLVGDALGAPDWVWQRVWWTLLLFAAYLGTYLLAAALGIGSPGTRLIGALAYALAPRVMSTIGPISSETLAMAIAPWVVLPLVSAARTGRLARGGLLSGVALLFAGGINAAATLVLCVAPALYLATRVPGAARRRLIAWWSLGTVLACTWWLIPLLVLRAVSPPFLDYIEDAAVTTRFSSIPQALRGTEHWLAFLADASGPVWRSGWLLVTVPVVILYTMVVASLGLAGISLRSLPEKAFVRALLVVGIALVTLGYVGNVDGIAADAFRTLLDGPLAPIRNTHKFDPIVRMALALGLTHAVARLMAYARGHQGWELVSPAVYAVALLAVAGTAFPAYLGQLAPRGSFTDIPGYWREMVADLAAREPESGRILLAPGSSFGQYLWGQPRDEPVQALGEVPWLVRDAIPLTPPETIRMLDAVQARFATGRPSVGLADQLAAAGVQYLVLRSDLDTALARASTPSVVRESLRGATGLRFVADFGPFVGGQLDDGAVVDRGLSQPYRALEVFEVIPYQGLVSAMELESVPVVSGGPENVVDLRDAGVIGWEPTLLEAQAPDGATGPLIQTDGIARREMNPGRIDDNVSARLLADDPGVLGRRVRDYQALPGDAGTAPAAWVGDAVISSTSSASDANAPGGTRRSASAAAALDGDLLTAWWSIARLDASPEWQVTWAEPREVPALRIALDRAAPGPRPTSVTVTTEQGERAFSVPEDEVIDVPAAEGPTSFLRLQADGPTGFVFAVRDILGLEPVRRTALVPAPTRAPAATVLSAVQDGRPWCVHPPAAVICTDLIGRAGEEDAYLDRTVTIPGGDPMPISVTAVPRPGPALDAIVAAADARSGATMVAVASSSVVPDPEGGPRAAIDGDLETAWIAADDDDDPTLSLAWSSEREITGLQLRQRLGLPASRPLSALVSFSDGQVKRGRFDDEGFLRFDSPVRASSVKVRFPLVQDVFSVDPSSAGGVVLPVGVADLRILGAVDLMPRTTRSVPVALGCGEGPVVSIAGSLLPTTGRTTLRDITQGLPMEFDTCGGTSTAPTAAGLTRVLATGGDRWGVRRVVLGEASELRQPVSVAARVGEWSASSRTVDVSARDKPALLVVRENANPGWVATLDGQELPTAKPDGWQQGWIVPPGPAATVVLRMRPQGTYVAGLAVGFVGGIALLIAAAVLAVRQRGSVQADRRLGARIGSPTTGWVLLGLGLAVIGGLPGLATVGVAAALTLLTRRAGLWWVRPGVVVASTLAAGLILALGAWPFDYAGDSPAAAILVLTAIAVACSPAALRGERPSSPGSPALET